jgi:SynChlorMet cassette radical SAM/SPASM protein ScmF
MLPIESFEIAVHEAKPLGLTGVKLTGGEPLMHPQILQLLEIVRQENLRLTIETNGLLCTPEIAAEIAKSPQRHVSVSLDGADADTHEWVRGVKGAFEAACQAVRNLADAGIHPQVIFSVMKVNVHQVDAIVRLAEQLGAYSVKFNVVQPTARGEKLHQQDETLKVDELIALNRRVESEMAPSTHLSLFFDLPLAFRPMSRMASDGCGICGILTILGVIPSGHYALCGIGEQVPELVFGAVGSDTLKTVWHENPTLNTIRNGLPNKIEGVCASCLMKYRCLGSCIAQNYYRTQSLWAPFWFCEQAEAAGLFPRSRQVPEC